jgi:cell wall assembly regulator SMI1
VRCGVPLPEGFKAFYRWHNGEIKTEEDYGIFGEAARFLPIEEILEQRAIATEKQLDLKINGFSVPPDQFNDFWNPLWLPVFWTTSDLLCLDMIGSYNKPKGQIIEYRLLSPYYSYVVIPCPNFEALICAVVAQLDDEPELFDEDGYNRLELLYYYGSCAPGYPQYYPESNTGK